MKIFRTVSVDVIRECRLWFGIPDIKVLVVNRKKKFLMKYANSVNCLALVLCQSIIVKCIFLFYVLLVFLLPYRIYGEIKLCIQSRYVYTFNTYEQTMLMPTSGRAKSICSFFCPTKHY